LVQHTKTGKNLPMSTYSVHILNGHNIYQMVYYHFPFKGPQIYTQIGIFGMKINHMATLCNLNISYRNI
jgi:hypothetical protein